MNNHPFKHSNSSSSECPSSSGSSWQGILLPLLVLTLFSCCCFTGFTPIVMLYFPVLNLHMHDYFLLFPHMVSFDGFLWDLVGAPFLVLSSPHLIVMLAYFTTYRCTFVAKVFISSSFFKFVLNLCVFIFCILTCSQKLSLNARSLRIWRPWKEFGRVFDLR